MRDTIQRLFSLDDVVALVTGSSGGIGLALARGLAEAGARVVVNGRDPTKVAAATVIAVMNGCFMGLDLPDLRWLSNSGAKSAPGERAKQARFDNTAVVTAAVA